jgi:hypothetical protein
MRMPVREVADADRGQQPFGRGAPIGRGTWLVCLTPRDNFKVFGGISPFATLALISIAAGAGASVSAAKKHIGGRAVQEGRPYRAHSPAKDSPCDAMIHRALSWRAGRHFTLSSAAIPFTEHAAPCCKPLGRMLIHPVGELRCAHQAGLHRDVSEVRGGDGLLVAICRRRQTAEHGDDRDHDRTPSPR